MSYYLFQASYTPAALKAMVENPSDREAAARKLIEAIGGKLHHLFFAMGRDDIVCLIEAPDDATMAAGALAVGAGGAMSGGHTTKLMTASDAMAAMAVAKKVSANYKPPNA